MGSIGTQTDFADLTEINDYNVEIFLCLVKNNEASTQCSLLSTPHKHELLKKKKRKRHSWIQNNPNTTNKTKNRVRNQHEVLSNDKEIKDKKSSYDIDDAYLQFKYENKIIHNTQDLFCELELSCDQVNNEKIYLSRKITKPIPTEEIAKLETDIPIMESSCFDSIPKMSEHNISGLKKQITNLSQHKNTKSMISLNVKKSFITNFKKYKKDSKKKPRRRQVGPFKCEICDIEFELFSPYSRHLSSHQTTEGKCCKICNKILSSEINLKRHMLIHTGKPFICEVCGKGFTGHYMLRDHLLNQHKQPTTKEELQTYFQCTACKSFLASSGALAYHQAREHKCKLCQRKWPCRNSLREHILTDHDNIQKNDNGQIVCSFCDETFLYRHSYINHITKHNGEKNYECGTCGKKCSTTTSLQFHVKQVHEKHNYRYPCSYCTKKFMCNAKLIEHERIHTGEKPFSCTLCNMSFAAKATYKNHVRLVHNGTPKLKSKKKIEQSVPECNYECPLCTIKNLSINELEAHCLEIHSASVQFLPEVNNEMVKVYTF